MDTSSAEGTFCIDSTTATKTCTIRFKIPKQVIYLRSYRIQFDTAANALSAAILYMDAPFFSSNQMLDTNLNRTLLPLLLDNAAVTHTFGKSIPIYLNGDIPQTFDISFLNAALGTPTGFARATLCFSLNKGSSV